MRCKANCRGFTLAELLIVVAIIAILVAIAAPLFAGELNNAKEAVREANIRAVKSIAVSKILTDRNLRELDSGNDGWYVSATIHENGDIVEMTVSEISSSEYVYPNPEYQVYDGIAYVLMFLSPTEVSAPSSPSDP